MGFGSYDESEQRTPETDTDDDGTETVRVHGNDHEGEVTFESGASTGDLVGRLADIKSTSDDE